MDCIDLVDKKSATELGHIIKSTKWVRIDLVDWFSDRFCIQRYQKSRILSKSTDQVLKQAFFGRFSATLTNSSWRNLEFFKKFLEFFRKFLEFFRTFLEFIQKNGRFIQNSLKFSNFKLRLVEKLKFGQIFVSKSINFRTFLSLKN